MKRFGIDFKDLGGNVYEAKLRWSDWLEFIEKHNIDTRKPAFRIDGENILHDEEEDEDYNRIAVVTYVDLHKKVSA